MVRIEAIVRPRKLTDVRVALDDLGHHGISVTDIKGAGKQKGYTQHFRGSEYEVNLRPKVMISLVTGEAEWEKVVDAIERAARTGDIGDGKIFVSPVVEAVRIRTGDRGADAIS
jgi:nitrogen regulatory protein PII